MGLVPALPPVSCRARAGHCRGRLRFASSDGTRLRIWELEDAAGGEWALKHEIRVRDKPVVPNEIASYKESLKQNYPIGMRFKMRFEGGEAPEQRFTGTIVGNVDPKQAGWAEPKWRYLKVRRDEASSIPRPERVFPWQIEPAVSPPPINPLPVHRPKRPCSNVVASLHESSAPTKEGPTQELVEKPSFRPLLEL